MEELLRKLGLTDGEIKVYLALLPLGPSRVDAIMKATSVSSSKVYLILERLVQKGLVSKSDVNGVMQFEADTPEKILDYASEREKEWDDLLAQVKGKLHTLKEMRAQTKKAGATVYTGWEGLRTFFLAMLDELRKGDVIRYQTISFDELTFKHRKSLFENFNAKREDKGIGMRVLTDNRKTFDLLKSTNAGTLRLTPSDVPDNTLIFGDKIALITFSATPEIIVVRNERIAKSYAHFFDTVWARSKRA